MLSTRIDPMLADLQRTGAALSAFSADLERISDQLDNGDGPAGALLHDTLMQEDLRQTLRNINDGTARFNENMEAMKHNFLFRGYFRKQEKQKKKEEEKINPATVNN
jgi:phospholipid/cholesterol/gamma-HCH transport system substrate-binding protein